MREVILGETEYFDFTTRQFSDGVPTTLAGTPACSVLEENNATPITSGVSLSVDRASVTGLNMATVVATAGNGYEADKTYSLYISTGTVGGTSVVGEIVEKFRVVNSRPLQPTTAGNTLDVTAGGAAGIDWGNVENPTTAVDLSATDIQLCDTVTVLTDLTTAQTEGYATDGSTATPVQLLYMIWALLAEANASGTTVTVKKLDGSTTAMTFTIDDATTPTSITRAT